MAVEISGRLCVLSIPNVELDETTAVLAKLERARSRPLVLQASDPQTKNRTVVRFTIMWGRVWGRFFAHPKNRIDIKALF